MNQQKKIINSFIHMTHLQYQKNIEDRKNFVKALEELENLKKDNSAYEQNVIQLTKNIYQFSKQELLKFNSQKEELLLEIKSLKTKTEILEEKIASYERSGVSTNEKKQKNILFIRASQLVQKKVLKVLDQNVYEVTFVDSIEDAIQLSSTVKFDFFFTDIENMSEKFVSLLS